MSDTPPSTVTFSLTVNKGAEALAFYEKALGAEIVFRMDTPDGGVAHAEMRLGNSTVYLSEEDPEMGAYAMPEGSTASCLFSIVVDSCDDAYKQAVDAGAQSLSKPTDHFWGMRGAIIRDPYGYRWSFGQIIEQLTNEEIAERAKQLFGG